ncbi:MAG TPA: hypothetical protein VK283_00070 [Acidimicrobiales bacterium]|nr:hypothetical protein [Acidimicrobiales bacterium]
MSAGWVAAQVRSRGLVQHCLGPERAYQLAAAGSLRQALEMLASTAYAKQLRPDLDLAGAGRAVFGSVLWNLRVLAGWSPPLGASRLRVLAGAFELANLRGEIARLEGIDAPAPYALGSLATVPRLSSVTTVSELRKALAASPWGDPGVSDRGGFVLGLELALAHRVAGDVPEAGGWATTYATLVLARCLASGVSLEPGTRAASHARAVLGERLMQSRSLRDLTGRLPRRRAWLLADTSGPEDLWAAEARWWDRLWSDGRVLVKRGSPEPGTTVGAVAALAADAWRVRGALEVAAREGKGAEVLHGVA